MKKRFTEKQIIGFLREAEVGLPIKELCCQHGFSEAGYYLWRSKIGGMSQLSAACDITLASRSLSCNMTSKPRNKGLKATLCSYTFKLT